MRIKIIMPDVITPSQNMLDRWLVNHNWRALNQIKKEYQIVLIACGADNEKYRVKTKGKRSVDFISYRPRLIDSDNLSGGMKHLRNTLTEMRLIWDDSPAYLKDSYSQVLASKNFKTVLIIEDIENETTKGD